MSRSANIEGGMAGQRSREHAGTMVHLDGSTGGTAMTKSSDSDTFLKLLICMPSTRAGARLRCTGQQRQVSGDGSGSA